MPGAPHTDGMMWWSMGAWGWFWLLLVIAAIVAIVVLVTLLVGRSASGRPDRSPDGGRDAALRILEERFARGEIDREEFEERRRALRDDAG